MSTEDFNLAIDEAIKLIYNTIPLGKYEYSDNVLSKKDIFKLMNEVENLKKK